jgi:branched-chain amino acid transport system substrate-binding protein
MKTRYARLALVLALALLGAACRQGGEPGDSGEKPLYRIGFMGDLTGANSLLVVGPMKGAELAIKQANEKGDLPVRLELVRQDTQANPEKAAGLAQALASDDRVLAVIGPAFSGESFSAGPVLQQAGIPQVTESATNPGLAQQGWKMWFRALGNDNSQGGAVPDVVQKVIKGQKVFIGHDKTAYGEGLSNIVRDGLPQEAVVGFEAVDPGKEDYSALASKLVASGADVFFWGAYSPEAGKTLKQARDRGFTGTFLAADGSKDDKFLELAGPAAQDAYMVCPCADVTTSEDPLVKEFIAGYKAEYGEDLTIYSAEGYDSANLIIDAIRKAGAPGDDLRAYRSKLADNLHAVKGFKGTTKTYEFQPDGELVPSAVIIYLYQVKDGKYVILGKASDLVAKAA